MAASICTFDAVLKLDDALSILGVTRDTDVASGRRAYLRLLKTYPPEKDPEGFKQLRAAYELAQPFFSRTLPDAPSPSVLAAEPPLVQPNVAGPDVPSPDPGAAQSSDLEMEELSLASRFWDEDDPAAQEDIAREAVRQTHSLESYQLLLEALDVPARRAEFIAAAREAVAHGHLEGLVRLCDRWPSALTDGELDDLREGRSRGVDWPRVAIAYVERAKAAIAAEIATAALARETADPLASRASGWWVLKLITAMFKTAPAEAIPLFRAVDHQRADDRDIPAVQLLLLRELAAVCLELPPAVCVAIATSIDEGDSATARDDLIAFAGEHSELAKQAARAMKRHAPTLAAHYGDALQAPNPFHVSWSDWKLPWWSVFLLLNLVRLACQDTCSSTHQSSPTDLDQLKARTVQAPEDVLCADRASTLCAAAGRWAHAQDCPHMFDYMHVLEQEFAAAAAIGKVSDAQQEAFLSVTKTTLGICEQPATTGSPR